MAQLPNHGEVFRYEFQKTLAQQLPVKKEEDTKVAEPVQHAVTEELKSSLGTGLMSTLIKQEPVDF